MNKSYISEQESTRVTDTASCCLLISDESTSQLYEWFEVSEKLIDLITYDMFMKNLRSFFPKIVSICDIDGPISNTPDLRRSLRTLGPIITIRSLHKNCAGDQDCVRTSPPIPYTFQS
jgi:hypothetical protein